MFHLLVGVLLITAASFIVWPLWRQRLWYRRAKIADASPAARTGANIALYRDHLHELTQNLAAGIIDESQYRQLQAELARKLLDDREDAQYVITAKQDANDRAAASPWLARGLFGAALLSLPILAMSIYQHLGANSIDWKIAAQLRDRQQLLQQSPTIDQSALDLLNRRLIAKLEESIEKFPNNPQTWLLHAQLAVDIQAFDKAINSYQQALKQQPQSSQTSSQIMAELAQTLFISAGNRALPTIEALSTQALAMDPDNVMALSLSGMMAFYAERYAEAIEFWQRVLAQIDPQTTDAQTLQQGITQARSRLTTAPSAASRQSIVAASGGPAASGHKSTEGNNPAITIAVSLADNIDFQPNQTVFVYARAWQGPKMPLAIAKLQAKQLPLMVTLDQSMAMSPSVTLDSAGQLELVARLSLSGDPLPKAGDWQASYGPVTLSADNAVYPLVIDRAIQ